MYPVSLLRGAGYLYYRFIGESEKLDELKANLQAVINQVPCPIPEGQTFISFFESIWGTEQLMNVMLYGYFQLNSVLEALKKDRSFENVVSEMGVEVKQAELKKCDEPIVASNAEAFLNTAIENIRACGLDVPEIKLELVDNPMIQCAKS